MEYKERLRQFNITEKYKSEMDFALNLMEYRNNYTEVLDVGCGLGTFMDRCFAYGYDVNNYYEGDRKERYYLNEWPKKNILYISMLHSLAHIDKPKTFLRELKERYKHAKVTVITPNRYWLMMQSNINYKPDPTVVRHYTMTELKQLFKEAGYEVTLCGQFGDEANGVNERIFLQAK